MIIVIRKDGTISEDGDGNVMEFTDRQQAQSHADEVAKEEKTKTTLFETTNALSGYRIIESGSYFHVLHHCGQTCEIEFSQYDGSVPWIKITCPAHGSVERKLWQADVATRFIKKMHGLNPR